MKKIKIYLIGQKYEIELEDDFYEFIKDDINMINNSDNQVRDLLNLMLSNKYKLYNYESKLIELSKKI